MRPIRFERLTRWGVGALMLLLIHGLGAPRSAWAGCSHLVVAKSDRLSSLDRLDRLIVLDHDASVSDDMSSNSPAPPGPKRPAGCSGPGCSNRVPMPVPTTFQAVDGTNQWGDLSVLIILPSASPRDGMADEPTLGPASQGSSIFHPPRA
jgi:hypothetical protein